MFTFRTLVEKYNKNNQNESEQKGASLLFTNKWRETMITSKSNELVKYIKSLHQKKYREEYQKYFVEGIKLVKEAIAEKMPIHKMIICQELYNETIDTKKYEVEYVNQAVFEFISDTKSPQGIMAIIDILHKDEITEDTIFALDNIQDPGNLGTIIRTLDCAGIQTLLLSKGTVDLYNPKVIRSTMGAIYRVNTQENLNLKEKLLELKKDGYQIVITDLLAQMYHYDLNFKEKLVIVIGNEANGISEEIKELADIKIKIPMLGRTESLNAGVAASIVAYERVRHSKVK